MGPPGGTQEAPPGQGSELPPLQAAGGLRLREEPERHTRAGQHARRSGLGHLRPAALPDRRLRHRQITPADRDRHRHRHGRSQGPTTTANLVNELAEPADEKKLGRTLARYSRVDLLCLDEFGYLDLDKPGAKLLFQVFTEREERRAIGIASNAPFSEWKQTFTDPRLCAAIVDRVTFNAHIIETGTDSFRLAQTQEQRRRAGPVQSLLLNLSGQVRAWSREPGPPSRSEGGPLREARRSRLSSPTCGNADRCPRRTG